MTVTEGELDKFNILLFLVPANTFPDRLMVFVLQRLENSNERNRMGSLAVLRHLINSSSEF